MIVVATRKLSSAAPHPYIGTRSANATDAPAMVLASEEVDIAPLVLLSARQRLRALRRTPENWDGYGSARPDSAAIDRAQSALLNIFRGATNANVGWFNPHVSANETGEVVFEWWRGTRKLTLYIAANEASFVRVSGDDVENDIEEGALEDMRGDFASLWVWLNS